VKNKFLKPETALNKCVKRSGMSYVNWGIKSLYYVNELKVLYNLSQKLKIWSKHSFETSFDISVKSVLYSYHLKWPVKEQNPTWWKTLSSCLWYSFEGSYLKQDASYESFVSKIQHWNTYQTPTPFFQTINVLFKLSSKNL